MGTLTVLRAGPLTTVQDLGRTGHRRDGVSLGGALDRHAAAVANLLVGNEEGVALLELGRGLARFRFSDDRFVAWCGGRFQFRTRRDLPAGHACLVRADEELEILPADRGARAWLAISGGIDVPCVLGSRATDLRANFGGWQGRALGDGDELALGQTSPPGDAAMVSPWSAPREWSQTATNHPILRIVRGSEWDEFSEASRQRLFEQAFLVSPKCDRMGLRLEGGSFERTRPNERVSEPVAPGTIQVPDDGEPIVLLGDCQTIGGYPKIAHVIGVDLGFAAQLQPEDEVRFQEVSSAEARSLWQARTNDLVSFRIGLDLIPGRRRPRE